MPAEGQDLHLSQRSFTLSLYALAHLTVKLLTKLTTGLKGDDMEGMTVLYTVRVAMVSGIFAAGFLCGSVTEQREANA